MKISAISFRGCNHCDCCPISKRKVEKFAYEQEQRSREEDYSESLRTSKISGTDTVSRGYERDVGGWSHRKSTYVDADGWVHNRNSRNWPV